MSGEKSEDAEAGESTGINRDGLAAVAVLMLTVVFIVFVISNLV